MSWERVRAALATRVAASSGGGIVSQYEKWLSDSPESAEFAAALTDPTKSLHYWFMEKGNDITVEHGLVQQYTVYLRGVYAFKGDGSTANVFATIYNAVCADLRSGDRQLGGACEMIGLADAVNTTGIRMFEEQIAVHACEIRFTVNERIRN